MNERLLQFIWQFQYFNTTALETCEGESLEILAPGQFNTNQGPDFTSAMIRLGETTWAGTVELHIKSSDWIKHAHQNDNQYKNVILHVVWDHDERVNSIPVLELKNRVAKILLHQYSEWMNSRNFIPCEKNLHTVSSIVWSAWKERLLAERLLRKAGLIEKYLEQNNYHWEESFWWLLARNFGMKVNADCFESIARSLPLAMLARKKNQIHQLEALLIGQAGLLNQDFEEDYPRLLQREYRFQQKLEGLQPLPLPPVFLRMRPVNFPLIRLAQLAMLVHESAHLFSKIKEASTVEKVRNWFAVTANDYWHYHYRFDEVSAYKKKTLGEQMTNTIIINTVVPLLYAYGHYHRDNRYKEKALQWLEQTGPEENSIIKKFKHMGIPCSSGYDTQSLIELKNEYCQHKKCLDCAAGNNILKQSGKQDE
ncbi:MAG TPA: DUF2851 family protein [Chitinophagaceae bacterium]|nr:DUF2851 family protein [Chitinophagaceae bacterium]HEX5652990.1 DUF2851 family protein [Chitinophagaceae bacterium]